MKPLALLLSLAILLPGPSALAKDEEASVAPLPLDPEKVLLPPYPKAKNLVSFASDVAGYQVLVDRTSISVGSDEVVRYALVLKTSGGASNVSYEGLRCGAQDRIAYAYGRDDGSWVRSRRPEFQLIPAHSNRRYYRELMEGVFCERRMIAGTALDMARAIARPRQTESR